MREAISGWWTVDGGASRNLLTITHAGPWGGLFFGLIWLLAALFFSVRSGWGFWKWVGGIGTGLAVAAGWGFNYWVSKNSFEVVNVALALRVRAVFSATMALGSVAQPSLLAG